MKCLYCSKELSNPKAKFCSAGHKMKYRRENNRNSVTVKIVTETPDNRNKEEIIVTKVKTVTSPEKELVFTKGQSIKERVEIYKKLYPDSPFVPNWIRNGFLTQNQAIEKAIADVRGNLGITNLGLGV